jgi:hypothetical protein
MRWKSHLAATTVAAFHTRTPIARARFASQSSPSSTPFPFPAHRNPTPHQIFHLPSDASQAEIKARCMFVSIYPPQFHSTTHTMVQITSSREPSIQTRQFHGSSLRACATPAFTPSPGPTTSSVGRHPTHAWARASPQTMNTLQSSPADDASTPGARHTTPATLQQDMRRRLEPTMRGRTS